MFKRRGLARPVRALDHRHRPAGERGIEVADAPLRGRVAVRQPLDPPTARCRRNAADARRGRGHVRMPQAVCRRVLQPEPCERVGAPPLNDAAGAQAHVGVGHRQQLVEPMLGYHHRGAAALELGQDAHERLGALRVQVGRGFVQHEHGRTARDGGGEGHPLLLAARQLGQLLAQKPFHAARLGGGMHAAHGFGGVHPRFSAETRSRHPPSP